MTNMDIISLFTGVLKFLFRGKKKRSMNFYVSVQVRINYDYDLNPTAIF